jgi:transcriptional regulator with XRE-family HTH domain
MDNFEYNFELLKATRLSKKISAQSMAADLCLAERQIISIEENSAQYFPSKSLKYTSFNEVDPTPSLLKKP